MAYDHTKYRRSKKGLVAMIQGNQRDNAKRRNHPLPTYTLEELRDWMFAQPNFETLYSDWVKSDYAKDKRPSVDRVDDYKSYTLDNIQLVTFRQNYKRSHADMMNGVNNKRSKAVTQHTVDGEKVAEYWSINQASRETGLSDTNISKSAKGKRDTVGGFVWKYV